MGSKYRCDKHIRKNISDKNIGAGWLGCKYANTEMKIQEEGGWDANTETQK